MRARARARARAPRSRSYKCSFSFFGTPRYLWKWKLYDLAGLGIQGPDVGGLLTMGRCGHTHLADRAERKTCTPSWGALRNSSLPLALNRTDSVRQRLLLPIWKRK